MQNNKRPLVSGVIKGYSWSPTNMRVCGKQKKMDNCFRKTCSIVRSQTIAILPTKKRAKLDRPDAVA